MKNNIKIDSISTSDKKLKSDLKSKKNSYSVLHKFSLIKDWVSAKFYLANKWADEIYSKPWIVDSSHKARVTLDFNTKAPKKFKKSFRNKTELKGLTTHGRFKNPTIIKLNKDFLEVSKKLNSDFLKTSEELDKLFLKTSEELSKDFLEISKELDRDFLETSKKLNGDFLKITKKN